MHLNGRRPPIDIFFGHFLRGDGSVGGGGIGTNIGHLCPALTAAGYETTVYQCSDQPFEKSFGETKVIAAAQDAGPGRPTKEVVQELVDFATRRTTQHRRIQLFMADFFSVPTKNPLAICMQNGLAWDAPIEMLTEKAYLRKGMGEKVFRMVRQYRGLKYFETCYNRVAADLYFINWYRSFRGPNSPGRIWYIPNGAVANDWNPGREERVAAGGDVRIIFARRLVPEKGTRVAADAFAELLRLRPNVRITVAGEGPDREMFASRFAGEPRLSLTIYPMHEAVRVHGEHDISVVPSCCGEATCLTTAEAMSAGCAVIASNLGGSITQIIDRYNGVLCWPTKESLLEGLLWLVDNPSERLAVQKRGWEVAGAAFGLEAWQRRWIDMIAQVIAGEEQAARELGEDRLRK
jgi:glycosyltransferase involved in cell wall biosynthesis